MDRRLILLACVTLVACNKAESPAPGGNAAEANSAAAADTAPTAAAAPTAEAQMRPGEWEMTTELLDMNMPGVPAGAMPKQMSNTSFKTCMKQQKPDASFFQGNKNSHCTYSDFSMSGGRVRGTATCDNGGQTMTMTMDGRYASESYDMTMAMKSEQMSMKMHTAGKRVGDCPAS